MSLRWWAELKAMGDDPENSARSSSRVVKKERERLGVFRSRPAL